MLVISSEYAVAYSETQLISALKNTPPGAPFSPLDTEKLNALKKMADILQGKIAGKAKLDTTETQTKIVEQRKNRTYPPLRVDPQVVTIPAALKPQTK